MKVYILDGPAVGRVVEVEEHIRYIMVSTAPRVGYDSCRRPVDSTFAYWRYRVERREDGDAEGHLV